MILLLIYMGFLRKALFAGSLLSLLSSNVKAADTGGLYINLSTPTTSSDFYYEQIPPGIEGFNGYDTVFSSNPLGANVYSTLPTGEQLMVNSVPPESTTPVEMTIINSSGSAGNLGFMFYDTGYGNTMANEEYMLELYYSSGELFGSYNVNDYASSGETVAIPNSSSLYGTLYEVPEPAAIVGLTSLLATAGGLYYLRRRKDKKASIDSKPVRKKPEAKPARKKSEKRERLEGYFDDEYVREQVLL